MHLCVLLKEQETNVRGVASAANLEKTIRSLREKIQYTLPKVGEIGLSSSYRDFSTAIQVVCDEVEMRDVVDCSACQDLTERFGELLRQVKKLS